MTENVRYQLIQAAKERFAALPKWRQQELRDGFNRAQVAARFHQEYRRD